MNVQETLNQVAAEKLIAMLTIYRLQHAKQTYAYSVYKLLQDAIVARTPLQTPVS
jgi:hypothetical protein